MVTVLSPSLQQSCMALAKCCNLSSGIRTSRQLLACQLFKGRPAARQITCSAATMDLSSSVSDGDLVQTLRSVVPSLTTESYKGQSGKVGVLGGCREYTGAPYFAAMSALRMGCDLAYVFCTPAAAPVIKGYSPELIVIPSLVDEHTESAASVQAVGTPTPRPDLLKRFQHDLKTWLGRLSVLIIGPGLGDDPYVGDCMFEAVKAARELQLPLIIDGSGLNFLAKRPEAIRGYSSCLLTPNIAEFGRLAEAVGVQLQGKIGTQWQQQAKEVAAAWNGPILLSKGPQDVITDGQQLLHVHKKGSPRRCGGQGDVLTGTTSAFISWTRAQQRHQQQQPDAAAAGPAAALPPLMLAAYGGCITMRAASALGFEAMGRSVVAGDMIQHLGDKALEHAGLLTPAKL